MAEERILWQKGDTLVLGGTCYRIQSVEGEGGSCVVYKASYEDALNEGLFHYVLIKELYPWRRDGGITRDEAGNLVCNPEAEELMELCRIRFRQGNQVNLGLLSELPSQTSGNLNSYEAYGTYYSVLTVHGGRSLEEILREERETMTLKRAVELTLKILDALEHFHKNGFLHLDISPDNILILPEQAMLIDYNSVYDMKEGETEDFVFSEKEGYTAPEVRLEDASQLGFGTDLYSVCAIFFRMLTGRRLAEDEWRGKRLQKSLSPDIRIFREQPQETVEKAREIECVGLQMLERKRYRSVEVLRAEFEELRSRIVEPKPPDFRSRWVLVGVLVLVLGVLGIFGYGYLTRNADGTQQYSAEQKEALSDATQSILAEMGTLNSLIEYQDEVLSSVMDEVLGDSSTSVSVENFRLTIQETKKKALFLKSGQDGDRIVETLKAVAAGTETSWERMEDLYSRSAQMKETMADLLDWLEYCLCDSDYSQARLRDFVEAYQEWLSDYTKFCGYEACVVRGILDEENITEMNEGMIHLSQIGTAYSELLGKSEEDYEASLAIQKEQCLEKSQEELNNYVKASNETTGQDFEIRGF